jgi:hypothetical protein
MMQLKLALLPLGLALSAPAFAEPEAENKDGIIVTGNRAQEAEITADTANAITFRSPAGKPLAKHYDPVCIRVFGMDAEYAEVLAERMRDNMRALGLVLLGDGCSPNIWVGFVPDSHAAVTKLSKDEPKMFGDLHDYEIDRVLSGSKAAQAWFAREDKNLDGKPMKYRTIEINGVQRTVKHNDPWRASRITGTIRVDMIGSIVIFDRNLSAGRTIRQLADYATFRALAPVRELEDEPGQPQSVLSLFAEDGAPPDGLTEFDWSYLAAYYKLGEWAQASNMHDAAKRAFLDGAGQNKAEKAGIP